MVKLTGPGLAQGASGTIAGQLTFSSSKGRAYLKKKSTPTQPRTPPQLTMRAMMAFLSNAWKMTPAAANKTWEPLAAETDISPFNAYMAHNLQRWRNFKTPTIDYPATETLPVETGFVVNLKIVGTYVQLYWSATTYTNTWCCAIFRVADGGEHASWQTLIGCTYCVTGGSYHFNDLTPQPGWNFYIVTHFSQTGRIWNYQYHRNIFLP